MFSSCCKLRGEAVHNFESLLVSASQKWTIQLCVCPVVVLYCDTLSSFLCLTTNSIIQPMYIFMYSHAPLFHPSQQISYEMGEQKIWLMQYEHIRRKERWVSYTQHFSWPYYDATRIRSCKNTYPIKVGDRSCVATSIKILYGTSSICCGQTNY